MFTDKMVGKYFLVAVHVAHTGMYESTSTYLVVGRSDSYHAPRGDHTSTCLTKVHDPNTSHGPTSP